MTFVLKYGKEPFGENRSADDGGVAPPPRRGGRRRGSRRVGSARRSPVHRPRTLEAMRRSRRLRSWCLRKPRNCEICRGVPPVESSLPNAIPDRAERYNTRFRSTGGIAL